MHQKKRFYKKHERDFMAKYALINATVFDGTDNVFKGVVIVDSGRIVDVAQDTKAEIPRDAQVIDLDGKFLMPGLIDAHLHLVGMRTGDFVKEPLVTPYETFVVRATSDLFKLIMAGYTTVGDAGGLIAAKLKPAIEEGTICGPRVVAAGLPLSPTFGHGDIHYLPIDWVDYRSSKKLRPLMTLICDGADECRKAARYALREDADFIKIMATGGVLSQKDRPEYRQFTLEEIKAIVDEARATGRFVHAHAQGAEGIKNALIGGVKVIAHAIFIDDEGIELAIKNNAILVPTFSIVHRLLEIGDKIGVPEWGLKKSREVYEAHIENIKKAYNRGAKIATGTDYVGGFFPMGGNSLEITLLIEKIGMTPIEALRAATSTAAEAVGLHKEIGRIAPGYSADLIVVKENPIENPKCLLNADNIVLVMKNGEIYKNKLNDTHK